MASIIAKDNTKHKYKDNTMHTSYTYIRHMHQETACLVVITIHIAIIEIAK